MANGIGLGGDDGKAYAVRKDSLLFAITRLLLIFSFSSAPVWAQEQATSFQAWKELQVLEAQNQVLRISAKINQIRSGKMTGAGATKELTAPLPSTRVKTTTDNDPLSIAEKDLRRARESLENINNLTLNDYVSIYLPALEGQPEVLENLIQSMSKEELGEIVKTLVNRPSRNDSSRKSTIFSGLTNSSTSSN